MTSSWSAGKQAKVAYIKRIDPPLRSGPIATWAKKDLVAEGPGQAGGERLLLETGGAGAPVRGPGRTGEVGSLVGQSDRQMSRERVAPAGANVGAGDVSRLLVFPGGVVPTGVIRRRLRHLGDANAARDVHRDRAELVRNPKAERARPVHRATFGVEFVIPADTADAGLDDLRRFDGAQHGAGLDGDGEVTVVEHVADAQVNDGPRRGKVERVRRADIGCADADGTIQVAGFLSRSRGNADGKRRNRSRDEEDRTIVHYEAPEMSKRPNVSRIYRLAQLC